MRRIFLAVFLSILVFGVLYFSKSQILAQTASECVIENPETATTSEIFTIKGIGRDKGSSIKWTLNFYGTGNGNLATQYGGSPQEFQVNIPQAGSYYFQILRTTDGPGPSGALLDSCQSKHNTIVTADGTTATSPTTLCWTINPGVRSCYETCPSQTGRFASKEECEKNIPGGKEGDACTPTKTVSCSSGLECRQTFGDNGICVSSKSTTQTEAPDVKCVKGLDKNGNETCLKVNTGIGTQLATDPAGFIKSIFSLLLGVSGGIAVILIIVSGYKLMTSQGNPERVQGAREMLTSAVVGLLFIIFSFVILQIIGVDILRIPGFG